MGKSQVVKDAIDKFPSLPKRAIALYLLHNYGPMWNNNLEAIRSAVRYQLGELGEKNRGFRPRITRAVKMPETWRRVNQDYHLNSGLWLVLADVHIPFHEPKPLEAAIRFGQQHKVSGIFFNGDIQDCHSVSYWPSAIRRDFDREIVLFLDFLDLMRNEFPKAEIVYKPGNHEHRLPRYYQSKAPELMGVPAAAMETVLGLEDRGIEFLDYHQLVYAGKLPILHGHEIAKINRAVNPARGLFLRTKSFAMCSHCHTTSEHTERRIDGTILTTWSTGCLCNLSPDFSPHGNNWNHGFATINVEKNGQFEVVNKRILPNGSVV